MSRHIRKPKFVYAKTKAQISAFVFTTWIVQFFLVNLKFQASNHFCGGTYRFESDLVRNPNCWFFHSMAQILILQQFRIKPVFVFFFQTGLLQTDMYSHRRKLEA